MLSTKGRPSSTSTSVKPLYNFLSINHSIGRTHRSRVCTVPGCNFIKFHAACKAEYQPLTVELTADVFAPFFFFFSCFPGNLRTGLSIKPNFLSATNAARNIYSNATHLVSHWSPCHVKSGRGCHRQFFCCWGPRAGAITAAEMGPDQPRAIKTTIDGQWFP